ncbi:MAG: hypothetical protein AB7L13_05125 [Acidimicrobiia bacterium]
MRHKIAIGIGAAALMLLAACGDDSSESASTTAAPSAAAATTASAAATTAAAEPTIKLSDTSLGKVLTDDKGRTLYMFTKDEPNKSNCTGGCLATWPPYTPASIVGGAGIDATKLGSIDQAGKKQVTMAGLPLYYYAGDAAAGDVKGQNVGTSWYVMDGTGKVIK